MHPQKIACSEKVVNGGGAGIADAEDGAEGVGAAAQVANSAKEFEGVAFFLERVGFAVGGAEDFNLLGLEFYALTFAGGVC